MHTHLIIVDVSVCLYTITNVDARIDVRAHTKTLNCVRATTSTNDEMEWIIRYNVPLCWGRQVFFWHFGACFRIFVCTLLTVA